MFSNLDAHSLSNIAREYNTFEQVDSSFVGLLNLIKQQNKKAVRNYGLPPKIGKYHRTYCLRCEQIIKAPANWSVRIVGASRLLWVSWIDC